MKVNAITIKEERYVKISNRFEALENMDVNVGINRTWESIAESIKTSAQNSLGNFEKLHYPWYEE